MRLATGSNVRRIAVAALCALLGQACSGQVTAVGGKFQLRFRLIAGTSLNFALDSSITGNSGQGAEAFHISMPYTVTVKSIVRGVASVEYALTLPGAGHNGGGIRRHFVKHGPTGRILGGPNVPNGVCFEFPQNPVKVGETWTSSVARGTGGLSGLAVNTKYRLMGLRTVSGQFVAAIGISQTASGAPAQGTSMTVRTSGMLFVLVGDGWLHSANLHTVMAMRLDGGKPIETTSETLISRKP